MGGDSRTPAAPRASRAAASSGSSCLSVAPSSGYSPARNAWWLDYERGASTHPARFAAVRSCRKSLPPSQRKNPGRTRASKESWGCSRSTPQLPSSNAARGTSNRRALQQDESSPPATSSSTQSLPPRQLAPGSGQRDLGGTAATAMLGAKSRPTKAPAAPSFVSTRRRADSCGILWPISYPRCSPRHQFFAWLLVANFRQACSAAWPSFLCAADFDYSLNVKKTPSVLHVTIRNSIACPTYEYDCNKRLAAVAGKVGHDRHFFLLLFRFAESRSDFTGTAE
jgi:hypothetical protein